MTQRRDDVANRIQLHYGESTKRDPANASPLMPTHPCRDCFLPADKRRFNSVSGLAQSCRSDYNLQGFAEVRRRLPLRRHIERGADSTGGIS
jgi:hypothetical protein